MTATEIWLRGILIVLVLLSAQLGYIGVVLALLLKEARDGRGRR